MATDGGAVFVHGSTLWLECAPFKRVDAGDHEIVVLQIISLAMYPDVAPMVFHRAAFASCRPPPERSHLRRVCESIRSCRRAAYEIAHSAG